MLDKSKATRKQENQIDKEKIKEEKDKISKIIKINDNKDYNTIKKGNKLSYLKIEKRYLFLKLFILFNLLSPVLNTYCITMKLIGSGTHQIISNDYASNIKVFIDDDEQTLSGNTIELSETDNKIVNIECLSDFTNCYNMFKDLQNIEEIDLSNFIGSNVISMQNMFINMVNIKKIIFPDTFDASNVESMYRMFSGCSSLESVNLNGFITTNLNNMEWMFYNCSSLETLDLSSFDTSKVTTMSYTFSHCSSLNNLNINNWNTGLVVEMKEMFKLCMSLTILDLNHFDTSKVSQMESMFDTCERLQILNIDKFDRFRSFFF